MRIALVADPHTTRGTRGQQPLYAARLAKVAASVNESTVSLVLIAGDLTESGTDEEYADFKEQIRQFKQPVLCVPGNHDVGGKWTPAMPESVTTDALTRYEKAIGESFFVRNVDGLRIIGLNSSIAGSSVARAAEQMQMLQRAVTEDPRTTTIVFMHYPPFRDYAQEPPGSYWALEPQPRRELLELFERANIRAVLSGHLHLPLVNHYGRIPIITSHPVSFGLPVGRQLQGWTLITFSETWNLHAEFNNVAD